MCSTCRTSLFHFFLHTHFHRLHSLFRIFFLWPAPRGFTRLNHQNSLSLVDLSSLATCWITWKPVGSLKDSSEAVRTRRIPSGLVGSRQDSSDPVRCCRNPSGIVRTRQDRSELLRTPQDFSGLVRTDRSSSGPLRTGQNSSQTIRAPHDPSRPIKARPDASELVRPLI